MTRDLQLSQQLLHAAQEGDARSVGYLEQSIREGANFLIRRALRPDEVSCATGRIVESVLTEVLSSKSMSLEDLVRLVRRNVQLEKAERRRGLRNKSANDSPSAPSDCVALTVQALTNRLGKFPRPLRQALSLHFLGLGNANEILREFSLPMELFEEGKKLLRKEYDGVRLTHRRP